MKVTVIPFVIGALGTIPKGLVMEDRNQKKIDHPNYSIISISQNTKQSPANSRRLAVTQNPLKDHQPTLVRKNSQEEKEEIIILFIYSLYFTF